MAMPSTKSSSSSLGRSNPNSRTSELSDPMRRSFTGNPFAKPSLIPNPTQRSSDFPRRNSVEGKEGTGSFFHDLDDKENGKDQILKPSKVRSPSVSSKNVKNFMAPTISASSKVTVSPRKKVLVERNEPVRSSAPSITDSKSPSIRKVTFAEPLHSSDVKPDWGCVEQKKLEALVSLDDGVPTKEEMHLASSWSCEGLWGEAVHDMNDVHFDPKDENVASSFETIANEPVLDMNVHFNPKCETVADEPDCVNLDPTFKLSPTPAPPPTPPVSSTSTILAPLDADPLMRPYDPLMPPYDPKTNYLSPRPQFLHYKPKPRIEREVMDSFMSGSFSDAEVTEDTPSEGSQKESDDASSDEIVEGEPSPAGTFKEEETVEEAKEVPKPRFFLRSKASITLLLLFSVAFVSISVTNSPVMDHTVFQDFYEIYKSSEYLEVAKAHFDRFSEFAKANFGGLARDFHTSFTKSLSSISELISNVRGGHSLGHLQYCNLTILPEYNAVNQGPIFGRGQNDIVEAPEVYPLVLNVEDSRAVSVTETDDGIGDISAEQYDSVYEEQVQQDVGEITAIENAPDDAPESEEVLEGQLATVSEQAEVDIDLEVQSSLHVEAADIHIEVFEAENLDAQQAQEDDANINIYQHSNGAENLDAKQAQEDDANINVYQHSNEDQPGLDSEVADVHDEAYGDNDMEFTKVEGESISIDAATEDNEQRLPRMVLYLLLCGGAVLIAGAAFNWSRKGNTRSTRVTSSVKQPLFAKAQANSLASPIEEQSYLEKPSLRNWPTEIDMQGESCPSEISSFQKSSSYKQRVLKELNEVHSLEKHKNRRESLASSDYSMGSPSYGSFTTYEKIQIKNGHKDEETVTPVRRSSRIRSQATSPL